MQAQTLALAPSLELTVCCPVRRVPRRHLPLVVLIHGTSDKSVPYDGTQRMYEALQVRGGQGADMRPCRCKGGRGPI